MCGKPVDKDCLQFRQVDDRARFCSFECMIVFAVDRIRLRRQHHNEQIAELREQVGKLRKKAKH